MGHVNLFPNRQTKKRPSNNPQKVFDQVNPFRRQSAGGQRGIPVKVGGGIQLDPERGFTPPGGAGSEFDPTRNVGDPSLTDLVSPETSPDLADRADFARNLGSGQPVNTNEQIGNAARLLAGAVASNPFITVEGLDRLQRGFVPDLGMIRPEFFRQSDPVIVSALQGLLESVSVTRESQEQFVEATRPRGLRG